VTDSEFEEPAGPDPDSAWLKHQLTEMILWADAASARSHQVNLGPSELSSLCDRQIGYRIAGVPAVNHTLDPWAAIVGTAIHAWLEKTVNAWNLTHAEPFEWITEKERQLTDFVTGHCDLFNVPRMMVVDHKSAGPDKMKEVLKLGPSQAYQTQVQLYGYGYEQAGYEVKKVALAFYPRSGLLRNLFTWVAPYDRTVAEAALARVPAIGQKLLYLDVLNNPHRWEQVDATPGHDCGFCDHYRFDRMPEEGASDQGCPGK
jgi:hypothetical protein